MAIAVSSGIHRFPEETQLVQKRSFLGRAQAIRATLRHAAKLLPETQDRNLPVPEPGPNR